MATRKAYTIREAAAALGVSDKTLYKWVRREGWHMPHDLYDQRIKRITSAQVRELQAKHARPTRVPDPPALPPDEPELPSHAQLTALVEALRRELADVRALLPVVAAPPARRPLAATKRAPRPPPAGAQAERLPAVYHGFREVARDHGIAETTVGKAIQTRRLPIIRGQWKVGRTVIQKALDSEGLRIFHALFTTRITQAAVWCPLCRKEAPRDSV